VGITATEISVAGFSIFGWRPFRRRRDKREQSVNKHARRKQVAAEYQEPRRQTEEYIRVVPPQTASFRKVPEAAAESVPQPQSTFSVGERVVSHLPVYLDRLKAAFDCIVK
jgi:hypothetical protein